MVYYSYYGIEIYISAEEIVILVLLFHISSFLSRAFFTMAKSYTSQSYMNGNRDCNTLLPWSNMQIILFSYSRILMKTLKLRGKS